MARLSLHPLDGDFEPEFEALARSDRRSILVDGFNVLHAAILRGREGRSTWYQREGRERVLARVAAWPERNDVLWVVFDGADESWSVEWRAGSAPGEPCPLVHVVFARSADDWMVRRARRATAPDRLVVVSADRQVRGRAESAGCPVWSPRAFVSQCGPGDAAPPKPAPRAELAETPQPPDGVDAGVRPSPKISS